MNLANCATLMRMVPLVPIRLTVSTPESVGKRAVKSTSPLVSTFSVSAPFDRKKALIAVNCSTFTVNVSSPAPPKT